MIHLADVELEDYRNNRVNKLKLILLPIDEHLNKLEFMETRTKVEALEVFKEINKKVGFYSIFNLVERLNIKDIEY